MTCQDVQLFPVAEGAPAPDALTHFTHSQTSVPIHTTHAFRRFSCENCGHEISPPIYCGDRFCEVCSRPRRTRVRHRIQWMSSRVKHPDNHSLSHLVLTAKNQPEITPMFDQLLVSFRRMRKTKLWSRFVSGGAFVVEVTGDDGNWHVHLHVIIYNSYFPHKQLSNLWNHSGGGTHIYIERLKKRDITHYLTKYLSKSEVAPKNRAAVNAALKHCRLFQPFGSWFKASHGYVQPKCECPICHKSSWISLDWINSSDWTLCNHSPPGAISYENSGDRPGDELLSVPDFNNTDRVSLALFA